MEQKQIEVLQWWYGNRDYQTGVTLYAKLGKNRTLLNTFMKPGKERFLSSKLHYQVCKAVGLNFKKMPLLPEDVAVQNAANLEALKASGLGTNEITQAPYIPEKHIPFISDLKLMQYPRVIRRLKMEYQENYKNRSIMHKKMTEVPEVNSPENLQSRADYLKDIKAMSARMEYLYKFIQNFEDKGVVPAAEEVWPPNEEYVLPENITDLKKLKKNLQTNNTKDRNQLLYQQKTKDDKENPMPEGPKRSRIENRIKKNEETILIIDTKIVELEK
ncbi:hypothetical protein OU798_07450 [Prolixibacteraceae bacterium Z1-6]|uniref:Uncharacterized protein n=1 Tax=Draconibacterium aestuarii TaxID=2998507 RepID=A0A9X3F5J5_9BACT|nr:hypothetical protein [Prolixibacteraceae bacterium Z1-6]